MTQPSAKTTKSPKGNRADEPLAKSLIKIALVEDHAKVRDDWTKLINSFPDFTCVCACGNGEEALRVLPQNPPDVVLMDIFLPRMSGIECTSRLKVLLPQTQIIMLTAMADQGLVFLALKAGADGYLLKRTKPSDLRTALLDVLGGGAPMTSEIARRVVELVGPSVGKPTQAQAQAIFTSGRAASADLAAALEQFGLAAGEFTPPAAPGSFDTPAVSA